MRIELKNRVRFDIIQQGEAFLSLEGTPYIKVKPFGRIGFNSINLTNGERYYWNDYNIVERREMKLTGF